MWTSEHANRRLWRHNISHPRAIVGERYIVVYWLFNTFWLLHGFLNNRRGASTKDV